MPDEKKCWNCGGTEFETTYDSVPYGSTNVQMPTGEVCDRCGEDYIDPEEMDGDVNSEDATTTVWSLQQVLKYLKQNRSDETQQIEHIMESISIIRQLYFK